MNGNTLNKNVTIMVSSCDLYEDAWMPFFRLLDKHWPNCKYPKVLITEEKEYDCDFMDIKSIKTGRGKSWTARLKYALDQIDSEYVLFFLEDFFLHKDVDEAAFEKALSFLNDDSVGMVHFPPAEREMPEIMEADLSNCFYELPVRKRTLRTRVAVTLFRKEYFQKLLYQDENPWQYERESHIRSMFAGYKIIRQDYSLYPPLFYFYIDWTLGVGITARKWLENTKAFLESQGIYGVDYDNLGILTFAEKAKQKKQTWRDIGLREYLYVNIKQPIKRKVRHNWIIQDVINFKKYIKYWNYYRKM